MGRDGNDVLGNPSEACGGLPSGGEGVILRVQSREDSGRLLGSLENKSTCEVSKEGEEFGANHVTPQVAKVLAIVGGGMEKAFTVEILTGWFAV